MGLNIVASRARPQANDAELLIVDSDPGPGAAPGLLSNLLDQIGAQRPELASRIRVHRLGASTPDLSQVRLVAFLPAEPLHRLSPEAHAEARRIALTARLSWIPVLNAPDALDDLSRATQARAWTALGLEVADGEDLRDGYRARAPGSLFARLEHRKRAFVFCGEVMNADLIVFEPPQTGAEAPVAVTSWTRRLGAALGGGLRREAAAADRAYFDAPPEATATLSAAARAVGLDFAAVEFSTTAEGRVRLWNAAPIADVGVAAFGRRASGAESRRRAARALDRFADALDRALAGELDTPFLDEARRAAA